MPRAPKLERTVTPSALPGVRRQAAETFESAGGPVALAQERFGQQAAGAALSAYKQIRQAEVDAAAATERLTITRRFNDLDHLLLQDNERGLLNKTGRDPMDAQDQYVDEWDTTADKMISGEIKTEGGRLFFEQERERRRDAFVNRASAHSAQQMRVYRGQELTATIASAVDAGAGAADPRDPRAGEAVAFQLQVIDDSIDTNAARLGIGPAQAKVMKDAARSQLHVGAVENLIARKKPKDAKDYYDSVSDQIAEAARPALLDKLQRNVDTNRAFQVANEIWDSIAASVEADDKVPIELDKLERIARERAAGDGEVYQLIRGYLRDRKQGVDDARRARQNTRDDAIWGAVLKGAQQADLEKISAFTLSPSEDQKKVIDFLRREQEHRAAMANAAESRAYTRAQRAEQELEDRGYGKYLELKSDPERLKALEPAEIMRMLPDIGRPNVNRILEEREGLLKSANAAKNATIDNDLFKDTAFNAGIAYAYKTPADLNTKEKARLGRLRAAVETEIQRASAKAPGGVLPNEEKRKVMQGILDRQMMLDTWGPSDTRIAQAMVLDDERGIAYVPLEEIDPLMKARFIDKLKALPSSTLTFGPPPSDDQVAARYKQRLQRAAAITALGGTVRQVDAILEGKED